MAEDQAPIIVKKKKGGHGGAHGGAWKVAYADFVTAMMALFIVLWILSQKPEVKAAVASYFKDPVGLSTKSKNVNLLDGKSKEMINFDVDKIKKREEEEKELKKMGERLVDDLSKDPKFSNLMDQIKIEIVDEGLRIELMDGKEDVFFEVGTAALKEKAKLLIRKIGSSLSKLPNRIVVEGHTDSRPYQGDGLGYTNFELSADRANAARKELSVSDLNEKQIVEVRGYADRKLRNVNDPYSVVNRRISIIVKYSTKT